MTKKTHSGRGPTAEKSAAGLPLDTSLFSAGDRVCVAVSGGADSTALLRILLARREELGIVLSVLHVEHGLRGTAAIADAEFVVALAQQFGVPCKIVAVDTPQRIAEQKESIETAARVLRYRAFRELLESGGADKVATAHTLDDQAETVLMKLLRGAWTEGLGGIHPVQQWGKASAGNRQTHASRLSCIRPFLAVRRAQIVEYLQALDQPWREDETNQSLLPTRNRIRHDLLPQLRTYNPRIEHILAHLAANARAEEQHWQTELNRLLPLLLLPGKPVRAGGRSVSTVPGETEVAIDVTRLKQLDPALLCRVLRATVEQFQVSLDFESTERLLHLVESGGHGSPIHKRLELPGGVRVERSAREIRFVRCTVPVVNLAAQAGSDPMAVATGVAAYNLPVPGTVDAPAFGSVFTASVRGQGGSRVDAAGHPAALPAAIIRAWQPGDRVELVHSRGPKKVKEVLNAMRIAGEERATWPVVVWKGKIVWMRGVTGAIIRNGDAANGESNSSSDLDIRETPIHGSRRSSARGFFGEILPTRSLPF